MSRRSRSAEETVTLFPFLAVLLCTMGTLVVIFVLVAQKTSSADAPARSESADVRADAAERAPNRTDDDEYAAALVRTNAATLDEIRSEADSLAWFRDELTGVRTRAQASLDAERERLANVEKAIVKLLEEADVQRRKLDALGAEQIAPGENALALQGKIDALDVEIERLRKDAETLRARNSAADAKRSYAIVPYQGKKGTFRRPIFVECCARGVLLQPEGVPFEPTDFLLAKYPGNPFDAGLRAAAARYLETSGAKTASGESIEPYPLLIVRPGGAEYYYPALAALASWGDVYGYELVADDEEIAYPEPDPILAQAVGEQARLARIRLAAQLADALSARRAAASFAGSRAGGAARFDGGSFGDGGGTDEVALPKTALQSRLGGGARLGAAGAKIAANDGANGFSGATELGTGSETISAAEILAADATPLPRYVGNFSQVARGAKNAAFVPNAASVATSEVATPSGVQSSELTAAFGETRETNDGAVASNASTSANLASSSSPQLVDSPAAAFDSTNSTTPTNSTNSTTPFLALLQTPTNAPPATASARSDAPKIDARQTLGNSTFAAGATGTTDDGSLAETGATSGATSTRIKPVERDDESKRDDDVAYAKSQEPRRAIRLSDELRRPATAGLERGVVVRCSAARLVFPKQPGLRVASTIAIAPGTSVASKESELLDALVLCVKSWGLAGRNMYWAPYLKAEVAPDGEERFRELSEFCRSQGLTIVRAETNDSTN